MIAVQEPQLESPQIAATPTWPEVRSDRGCILCRSKLAKHAELKRLMAQDPDFGFQIMGAIIEYNEKRLGSPVT